MLADACTVFCEYEVNLHANGVASQLPISRGEVMGVVEDPGNITTPDPDQAFPMRARSALCQQRNPVPLRP